MAKLKTVLVLCTGNSCRSQMAEAILNHDLHGAVQAFSAGTQPQPMVAEGALRALELLGLPTTGLRPKDVAEFADTPIDLAVSVCDRAQAACPVLPGATRRLHMPFHDPHGETLANFIAVRDEIRARLVPAVRQALGL